MGAPRNQLQERAFELMGGRLALDFANTVGGMRLVAPVERLNSFADLVSWGRQAGALRDEQARRLRAEGERRPEEAAAALRHAVEVREALFRVFRAVAEEREPPAADLERVNEELARALAHRRIVRRGGRFQLGWEEEPAALDAVLWPVLASAAEVLDQCDCGRVRICGAAATDECSWLFYDETRSGTRRWCSMKDCGNRAKARRHLERHRRRR